MYGSTVFPVASVDLILQAFPAHPCWNMFYFKIQRVSQNSVCSVRTNFPSFKSSAATSSWTALNTINKTALSVSHQRRQSCVPNSFNNVPMLLLTGDRHPHLATTAKSIVFRDYATKLWDSYLNKLAMPLATRVAQTFSTYVSHTYKLLLDKLQVTY